MFKLLIKLYKFTLFSLIISTLISCQIPSKNIEESSEILEEKKQKIINTIYQQQSTINLCNQQRDKDLTSDSINFYSLDKNTYLVEFLCFLGAYQSNYQYLLWDNQSSTLNVIDFATFDNSSDNLKLTNTKTLNGMVDYNSEAQTLTIISKSRGLGDCGSFAKYQWTKSDFQLVEYRYKKDCDEVYVSPENYPLIYP